MEVVEGDASDDEASDEKGAGAVDIDEGDAVSLCLFDYERFDLLLLRAKQLDDADGCADENDLTLGLSNEL